MLNVAENQLQWVRPPLQARSAATLQRILTAAETLLEKHAFEDLSIAAVVHEAQTSVGAFYKRFANKEALLRCLADRHYAELEATAASVFDRDRWKGCPLAVRVRAIIEFGVELFRTRRGLLRTIVLRNHGLGQAIPVADRAVVEVVLEKMVAVFLPCRDEIDHPKPELAIRFAVLTMIATLHEKTIFAAAVTAGVVQLTDEELADELERCFMRYLTGHRCTTTATKGKSDESRF